VEYHWAAAFLIVFIRLLKLFNYLIKKLNTCGHNL
jgi:hypothetical protein